LSIIAGHSLPCSRAIHCATTFSSARLHELSSVRFGPALDVLQDVEQELDGVPIAFGRSVDELLDDCLTLADFSPPAILGDDDRFVQRLGQQG
jgi:hypothetical protein